MSLLPRKSFQATVREEEPKQIPVVSLNCEGRVENAGGPMELEFKGQSTREERAAQSQREGERERD